MAKAFREHLTRHADYVGPGFAEEARKMHYGEIEHRSIYGEADLPEAKALFEEGIASTRCRSCRTIGTDRVPAESTFFTSDTQLRRSARVAGRPPAVPVRSRRTTPASSSAGTPRSRRTPRSGTSAISRSAPSPQDVGPAACGAARPQAPHRRQQRRPGGPIESPGWASVRHYAEIAVDERRLVRCHYPFRTWRDMGKGTIDLHGHSHGRLTPRTAPVRRRGRRVDFPR